MAGVHEPGECGKFQREHHLDIRRAELRARHMTTARELRLDQVESSPIMPSTRACIVFAASPVGSALAWLHRKSLKAARAAENGVKILRLLFGNAHDRTPRRGARGAPHAVHLTLRFSAEVFPLFATSSASAYQETPSTNGGTAGCVTGQPRRAAGETLNVRCTHFFASSGTTRPAGRKRRYRAGGTEG